jgi:hypothetical protein
MTRREAQQPGAARRRHAWSEANNTRQPKEPRSCRKPTYKFMPTLLSMTDPVPWDRSPLCARTEVRYRQLYRHHLTRWSRVPRLGYPLETPTTSNVAANIPDQRPMTVLARCFGEHLTVVAARPTVSNFSGRHLCINRIAAKLLGMPNRSHRHPFEGRQRSERRRSAAALDRLWTANTRPSSRG